MGLSLWFALRRLAIAEAVAGKRYVVVSKYAWDDMYAASLANTKMAKGLGMDGGPLESMLARQREIYDLNGMPNVDYDRVIGHRAKRAIAEGIGDFVKSCIHECVELEDWTAWKPWSQRLGNKSDIKQWSPEHIKEMRMEVVDIVCFALNLCCLLGINWQMLYKMFNEKMDININERHNSGTY